MGMSRPGRVCAGFERAWRVVPLVVAVLLCASCASVSREDVGSWRQAVVAARDQSQVTFRAVNELVRQSQRERAATLESLSEDTFAPALDSESVQRWNAALDSMAAYAGAVEQLLAPEMPRDVGESLRATGERLSATANLPLLKRDTVLSGAIGAIGAKLVSAAANARAREIMLSTDAAVKDLTEAMAAMLYDHSEARDADGTPVPVESGVLVTVANTWDDGLARIEARFIGVGPAEKAAIADEYAVQVASKEAAVDAIRSLRNTLLDLGPAHTAAAQGRSADLKAVIASAKEQIRVVGALLAELKAARAAE